MSQRNWFEDRERKKNILRTNSQWLKWIGQYFKAEMFICFIHIKSFRIYTKKHMLQFNENLNGYLSHWSTGLKSKFMCQFWKRPPSMLPIVAHSRHSLAFMHQYIVCGASVTQGLPLSPILCMHSILFNYSTKLCLRIIARVPFLSNTNFSFGWFIFLMSVCLVCAASASASAVQPHKWFGCGVYLVPCQAENRFSLLNEHLHPCNALHANNFAL